MSIAIFKSILTTDEGETVWDKLKQKVIDAAEAPAHLADGWFNSAAEALEAHELAVMEKENAALEAKIATEQTKLDGRTKAAKDLKSKLTPAPVETAAEPAADAVPLVDGGAGDTPPAEPSAT